MEFLTSLRIESFNQAFSTGSHWLGSSGEIIPSHSPADGKLIANVFTADRDGYEAVVQKAGEAFKLWRTWPAPKRGEVCTLIFTMLSGFIMKAPF